MSQVAIRNGRAVARPLKVLVPLIKEELAAGERAGLEHYRRAGEMLIEAKEQMPYGNFSKWLSTNFALSRATAYIYMGLAAKMQADPSVVYHGRQPSLRSVVGRKPDYHAWRQTFKAAKELDAELFAQERQSQDEEIKLRRELVAEWIDIGYRALATRLHPDRGGSKDAMVRLNDLRAQLTELAKTRRWI
jgi:hypothetical protein